MTPNEQQQQLVERARILAAFRATFSGPEGELVLATLCASAGVRFKPGERNRPSFLKRGADGHCDPIAAAFDDGRKSVLFEIIDHLDTPADETPKGPSAVGPGAAA